MPGTEHLLTGYAAAGLQNCVLARFIHEENADVVKIKALFDPIYRLK